MRTWPNEYHLKNRPVVSIHRLMLVKLRINVCNIVHERKACRRANYQEAVLMKWSKCLRNYNEKLHRCHVIQLMKCRLFWADVRSRRPRSPRHGQGWAFMSGIVRSDVMAWKGVLSSTNTLVRFLPWDTYGWCQIGDPGRWPEANLVTRIFSSLNRSTEENLKWS